MKLWRDTQGGGPDLVLLHGWGMNAGIWQSLLPGLRERFRVTRIELPGHGASPVIPGGLTDWAEACLAAAPERAAWVGWSLGGLIAQQAALRAAERIEKLCLVTATPCFVQRGDWIQALPGSVFEQFASALTADPVATLRRFLGLQVKGVDDARALLRLLDKALAGRPAADRLGLQQGLEILLTADLRNELPGLKVPAYWLFGRHDTLVPVALAGRINTLLPGARVKIVEGAGHAPFLSHAGQCLEWLELNCG